MKKLIFVIFVIGAVMVFFGCQEESALAPELGQSGQVANSLAKPLPNLIGTTNTPFNFPPLPDPGGSPLPVFWKGTIVIGEETYGLYFLSPEAPTDYGQSSHFWEEWVIHEDGFPENVCLRGWNEGVVSNANGKFRANGEVSEAYGSFAGWIGRRMHIRGIVVPSTDGSGFPLAAIGTLRIN